MSDGEKIALGKKVTLHFSLTLDDGTVIDSTFERQPASFVMGDGSLLKGFENKLVDMQAGDRQVFTVLPEEGFGQPNPNNIQHFTRKDFGKEIELSEGLVINFADANQAELPGVVKTIEGDNVTVDFNHPLAGRDIEFEAEIILVESNDAAVQTIPAAQGD